jgi:hypothetical protein
VVIRFGLLALTLFLCTPAHSETGNGLLQACEALEREARLSGDNIALPPRTDEKRFDPMLHFVLCSRQMDTCVLPTSVVPTALRTAGGWTKYQPRDLFSYCSAPE